ncbi:hypothetical protein Afil01_09380 [Actinorhabdospora filicis]|uniref:SnoaL-like domain-containing protein n=1 Tax=Actinorhabdospora filicis TaxID=1785913 RepID=A0A9W6W856_9ACTN|nr:nuclear transport factor 2 family protein [Actinorhabdospora filicis]GLZ76131.1 hypothetical protein Afil01_09380 [Actinorhabdospora filicis]
MTFTDTVRRYWETAEARDWDAFAALLADDVRYELPQTRERVLGKDNYLRLNMEYPGDWHISIHRLTGDDERAASWVKARLDGETSDAVMFFEAAPDGRIASVTDFWPESYEPPAGREHLVERY